jgi:uncharacterized membrane protein YkvI
LYLVSDTFYNFCIWCLTLFTTFIAYLYQFRAEYIIPNRNQNRNSCVFFAVSAFPTNVSGVQFYLCAVVFGANTFYNLLYLVSDTFYNFVFGLTLFTTFETGLRRFPLR